MQRLKRLVAVLFLQRATVGGEDSGTTGPVVPPAPANQVPPARGKISESMYPKVSDPGTPGVMAQPGL